VLSISGPKPRRSLPRRASKGLSEDFQRPFRRPPEDLYVSQRTFRKDLYIFQRSFRRPPEDLYVSQKTHRKDLYIFQKTYRRPTEY
jgi:hypothetical protein